MITLCFLYKSLYLLIYRPESDIKVYLSIHAPYLYGIDHRFGCIHSIWRECHACLMANRGDELFQLYNTTSAIKPIDDYHLLEIRCGLS